MSFTLDTSIIIALISALTALVVAFVTFVSTRSNQRDIETKRASLQADIENLKADRQRDIETWKADLQRDIENLKADQLEKKSDRDALRDYEYEARKRLYHECAPLIFQLLEQAEGVLNRIRNLARAASQGKLEPGRTWLSRKYYRLSTLHRFLEPLATLKLIQNRLTLVDLSLDPYLYCQYSLGKQIFHSFGDDFDLGQASGPPLDYDPHHENAESKRVDNPRVYWQQGVPIGILDNAVFSLIAKEPDGARRVMSFAEFESEYERDGSPARRAFDRIGYLFEDFHPRTRPVLWRMLIAQAGLYRALLHLRSGDRLDLERDLSALAAFQRAERASFDWRMPGEQVEDAVVLDEPFDAAAKYLAQPVALLLEKLTSRTTSP